MLKKKSVYILCITNAFTKYAVVTKINNRDTETVTKANFDYWFCKFGIPAQIHTNGSKEFVNKLSAELFKLLNIQHSKTSPYHAQCTDFLPASMLAYNTSYIQQLQLRCLNCCSGLSLVYLPYWHQTLKANIKENLLQLKECRSCSMLPRLCTKLLGNKELNKNPILTPMPLNTHSPSDETFL